MFFEKSYTGLNQWWRYIIVFAAVAIGYCVGQIPLILAVYKSGGADALKQFQENPYFPDFGINLNMGLALLLIMFLGAFAALYFIFKPIHQREFRTLITPKNKVNWSKIFFSFFLWGGLVLAFEMVLYIIDPVNFTFHFQWNTFIPLVLLCVFILPIQTSTEEFIFRGYLMQGIGMGTGSKITALIITSVLFGLIHSMNPEVQKFGFGTMQIYYISAGLFLGIMTLMDDGLELALGVHAATNFTGAVFVGYEGAAIQTNSIIKTIEIDPNMMTIGFYITAIIFLFIVKIKYSWGSFRKLIEPVKKPVEKIAFEHLLDNPEI